MQQLMLGYGAKKKTYIDDVFSTYLHVGTGSAKTINNGIDLAGEGGLIWGKSRSHSHWNILTDTERGANKAIYSDRDAAEHTYSSNNTITSFNSNGFSVGSDPSGSLNYAESGGNKLSAWTFRRAKGFFDVVTYTGNGSARTIAHSLGSVPGLIISKSTSESGNWNVYHRSTGASKYLELQSSNDVEGDYSFAWNDTAPTATHFSLGAGNGPEFNKNGTSYVAYLFAGGESTAATARSVGFDGNDYLSMSGSSDFAFGTGDFTWEAWIKPDNWSATYMPIFVVGDNGSGDTTGFWIGKNSSKFVILAFDVGWQLDTATFPEVGQWTHVAVTRSGTSLKLFYNGTLIKETTNSYNFGTSTNTYIAQDSPSYGNHFTGAISNLRIVKGTAVYTSSFRPPTEPLTNITNTKLLCCNNSSTTGSTVTPGTITANGNPTASSDSPFDDPAAFKFGDSEEGIIKCGSYKGNGSSTGPEINLGWEPQWVLIKNTSTAKEWKMLDSMRGLPTGSGDNVLIANDSESETGSLDNVDLTSTGFKLTSNNSHYNTNGDTYIYLCLRRPDGYVGKPPELGTDVLAMAYGNSAGTNPSYVSNFPVDFALNRQPATSESWYLGARLIQGKYLLTNTNEAENNASNYLFDHNNGWRDGSAITAYLSWMWQRHKGFDVVCYPGREFQDRQIPHSLNAVPEMIWVKKRSSGTENWAVYHKGLNGGTNPEQYYLRLNTDVAEIDNTFWYDTAPTSTHFSVGFTHPQTNQDGKDYLAMLFASVSGVSAVGSYTGDDSDDGSHVIDVGFTPRFLIIKRADGSADWKVYDTTNGFPTSGTANYLELNTQDARHTGGATVTQATNGFKLWSPGSPYNANNAKYIYYAHA